MTNFQQQLHSSFLPAPLNLFPAPSILRSAPGAPSAALHYLSLVVKDPSSSTPTAIVSSTTSAPTAPRFSATRIRKFVAALADQAARGLAFGAPTELELELADRICAAIPAAEKIRLVSSGTEAGMTALRLARAATGRPAIIKFDGCYHGHSDSLLVRAGSGLMTLGVPDSAGVPEALAALTRVAPFNSLDAVEQYFAAAPDSIAAVIVEPLAANMGVVPPAPGFLRDSSAIVHRYGALLICDEVITGFRLRYGAASDLYGAEPDLIMLGKIIGGGLPIGAVAGRAAIMDLLAPLGPVYQAGTLSGNPLSVRAGLETLKILEAPGTYASLETSGARLETGLRDALARSAASALLSTAPDPC